MAEYKINLYDTHSSAAIDPVYFTLPDDLGGYQLIFKNENGQIITDQPIKVGNYNSLYTLTFTDGAYNQVTTNQFAVAGTNFNRTWTSSTPAYYRRQFPTINNYLQLSKEIWSEIISSERWDDIIQNFDNNKEYVASYEAALLNACIAIPLKTEGGVKSYSKLAQYTGVPFAHMALKGGYFIGSDISAPFDAGRGNGADNIGLPLNDAISNAYNSITPTEITFPIFSIPTSWDIYQVNNWDDVIMLSQLYIPLVTCNIDDNPDFPRTKVEYNPEIISQFEFTDDSSSLNIAFNLDNLNSYWSDSSPITDAQAFADGIHHAIDCGGLLGEIWANLLLNGPEYTRGEVDWSQVGIYANAENLSLTFANPNLFIIDDLGARLLQLLYPLSPNFSDLGGELGDYFSESYTGAYGSSLETMIYSFYATNEGSDNAPILRIERDGSKIPGMNDYNTQILRYQYFYDYTSLLQAIYSGDIQSTELLSPDIENLSRLEEDSFISFCGSREKLLFFNLSKPSIATKELQNNPLDNASDSVLRNVHLRRALTCAINPMNLIEDIAKYDNITAYASLVNTYTTGDENENQDYYQFIQQNVEESIKVYDDSNDYVGWAVGPNQGFPGFYNLDYAEQEYALAAEEIPAITDHPIRLRVAYNREKDSNLAKKYISQLAFFLASMNSGLFIDEMPLSTAEMDIIFNMENGSQLPYDILIADRYLSPTAITPYGIIPAFYERSTNIHILDYQNLLKFCGIY